MRPLIFVSFDFLLSWEDTSHLAVETKSEIVNANVRKRLRISPGGDPYSTYERRGGGVVVQISMKVYLEGGGGQPFSYILF